MRFRCALFVPALCSGLFAFQDPVAQEVAKDSSPALGAVTPSIQEPRRDSIDGGPVTAVRIEWRGDDIPPVVLPGTEDEDGDEAGDRPTGNPYFIGYVAGPYFPPQDERIDPALIDAARLATSHGRPTREVFACVMFQKRLTVERVAELETLGVRFLGFQPHYAARCALPPESIERVAMHPAVRWVGFPRPWQKVQPRLEKTALAAQPGDVLDLWVCLQDDDRCAASTARPMGNVSESDLGHSIMVTNPDALPVVWQSNGWQQRALEELGVGIDWYEPTLRAFRAKVPLHALDALPQLDFVSFLEIVTPAALLHDESVPMIHADRTRQFWNGNSDRNAVVGLIDSGVESTHTGLDHVFMVGWDYLGASPWTDTCDHGTHVTGTILCEPDASSDPGHRGVAPGLGSSRSLRFRSVKAVYQPPGEECSILGAAFSLVLGTLRSPYTDSTGNTSPRPHVINNSWGQPHDQAAGNIWFGTEATPIAFDTEVYANKQVYVFAAGNDGPGSGTLGAPNVAKNVFTVGSVNDSPGLDGLSSFSSRGPCGDGRWKPNVVAPGSVITSTVPGNRYGEKEGTSMAAPHVTGLAAQIIDHFSSMAYDPPRLHAFLMATAWQRNNQVITNEADAHLDMFGAGRVDAYRTHYDTSDWNRTAWSYTHNLNTWRLAPFDVPVGATRLVVCMNYIEPPSVLGASQALVHDLDLYLDRPPTDPVNGNSGEYTAQISRVDNTEIRVINDPPAGSWYWKVWPHSMNAFAPLPDVGVTVLVVMGDREPDLQATLSTSATYLKPNESVDVNLSVDVSDYLASAVSATLGGSSRTIVEAGTTLLDGVQTDLRGNASGGIEMRLGDIRTTLARSARWRVRYPTEGTKTITTTVTSESAHADSDQETVIVDGTPPPDPTSLGSTTHGLNTWENSRTITFQWTQPNDNLSGVDGYADAYASRTPITVLTRPQFGATTTRTITLPNDYASLYYALRAFDRSGNVGNVVTVGPYRIDTVEPTLPTNLRSPTHFVGQWSTLADVMITWDSANDAASGLDGYGEGTGTSSPVNVSRRRDLDGAVTARVLNLRSSTSGQYYALRSLDHAGNWSTNVAEIGPFYIDLDAPSAVSNLTSTSHTTNSWSMDPVVTVRWTGASDGHSGLDGYAAAWTTLATTVPSQMNLTRADTSDTRTLAASASGWYFHIRPRDIAGNWGPTTHLGPFLIDDVDPGSPSGLRSPSHAVSQWSGNAVVLVEWGASVENESGLDGYASAWDHVSNTVPTRIDTAPGATSVQRTLTESASGWYFHLRAFDVAGNASRTAHLGPFQIDVTPPAGPANLGSTTHVPSQWSMDRVVRIQWDAATDGTSGLGGYSVDWDSSPTTIPATQNASAATTSANASLNASSRGYYAHVRARDVAGNWGQTMHVGPFLIDDQSPPAPGNLNSPTHATGIWTASDQLQFDWTTVTDPHSGLQSWRFTVDGNPGTILTPTGNLSAGRTSYTATVSSSATPVYLHLIAIDTAQNYSTTEHLGPLLIDADPPTNVTIDIGNNATSIATNTTTLGITAQDMHSGVVEMRLKNDGGTWSPWEPFAVTRSWDLFAFGGSTATGTRRVDLEVRDRAGNTVSAFDRVFYYRPFRWLEPGCAGSMGIPQFASPNVAAFSGASFDLTLSNTAAPAGNLYLGISNQIWAGFPLPLDLAFLNSPGCQVHVSLDVPIYSGAILPVINVPVINDPGAIGLVFYFQWLLFGDPSGVPVVTTRGLEAEINRS